MAGEEYTIADIVGHVPKFTVVQGQLYCDGTHTPTWAITEEEFRTHFNQDELKQYHPEVYDRIYGGLGEPCPVPECHDYVKANNKQSFHLHALNKHREWWQVHKARLSACKDFPEIVAMVKKEGADNAQI